MTAKNPIPFDVESLTIKQTKEALDACRSYRPGDVCADGFIQKPICHGHAGCPHCGHMTVASAPHCQSESLPPHWLNDNGSPRFYRQGLKE